MGLSQVFGIAKQHEGHVDVHTIPGAGTTFTIYLPVLLVEKPAAPDEIEQLQAEGLAAWVAKPPNLKQLSRVISHCLGANPGQV